MRVKSYLRQRVLVIEYQADAISRRFDTDKGGGFSINDHFNRQSWNGLEKKVVLFLKNVATLSPSGLNFIINFQYTIERVQQGKFAVVAEFLSDTDSGNLKAGVGDCIFRDIGSAIVFLNIK